VKALCFDYRHNCELFAVGDPDQALFGFTGTRPELLQELADRSDIRHIDLEENYRCGDEIIRVANLMRKGRPHMVGHRPGGHVSATVCRGGLQDQYAHVVDAALGAHRRGVPLHEIAVLCPTRAHCTDVTGALRDAGLATFFRDTNDYRLTAVTGFVEAAASWVGLGRELSDYRLGDLLRRWRSILGGRWTRSDNTALVKLLLKYAQQQSSPVSALMEEMMNLGLRQALTRVNLAGDVPEMARMSTTVESLSVLEFAERVRRQDRIEVTTMTSSKGLEFDVVLIVGADEESIPHYLSDTSDKLAEDRRKFYVSITRARSELRIFYSGFAITKYGRRKNVGPSRYLREIGIA
jgi:DNA helicase-2/ATP-dependent DNA helicase PcrA